MKKHNVVFLAIIAMFVAFGVATHIQRGREADQQASLAASGTGATVPAHAPTWGPEDALVVIVEFFDPACETCAELYRPVKKIVSDNPGRVRLVMRHAPFHKGSDQVVRMLLGARAQGKYWEALEAMFATQSTWTSHHVADPTPLWTLLPQVGIDPERLRTDMAVPAVDAAMAQDMADARALGVTMTPEWFVNGKALPNWGYEQLVALVEAEVASRYGR